MLKAVIGKLSEGHWAALPMHAGLSREERFRGRQKATQVSGHDTALLGLRAELNVARPAIARAQFTSDHSYNLIVAIGLREESAVVWKRAVGQNPFAGRDHRPPLS